MTRRLVLKTLIIPSMTRMHIRSDNAEYHMLRVYCWRARRLLAVRKLSTFEQMHDGNLGKVCGMQCENFNSDVV